MVLPSKNPQCIPCQPASFAEGEDELVLSFLQGVFGESKLDCCRSQRGRFPAGIALARTLRCALRELYLFMKIINRDIENTAELGVSMSHSASAAFEAGLSNFTVHFSV